ncbi:alpha/beta fold hydrolase [Vallitalea okinawensis]|uniref:alpha/beta fold hydrolase n=1 Tax=Vallitalea okinawensis TaxID=2078660 RepID=UPI000CFD6D3C|nr:alpha/beta hydrolase [Vallitalea okinawensis]
MERYRCYGDSPYQIVVVHGGPGAPGSVAPICKLLSKDFSVIEPFQSADTVEGQIEELRAIIQEVADKPITLIGHSWGAWLVYLLAASNPDLVKKVILVGCGAFEQKYVKEMNATRNCRFSEEDQMLLNQLQKRWSEVDSLQEEKIIFGQFGEIMSKAETFKPIEISANDTIDYQPEIYNKVMPEMLKLRQNGDLLNKGSEIQCPVLAIHGKYDAHPYKGVIEPLKKVVSDFEYILLKDCGHYPWNEVLAHDKFFEILKEVI